MKFNYQSEIRFSKLPFNISEKDIIYVESEYNEDVNRFIQMYYKEICNDFKRNGYNFIYFPRLSEDLLEEIINTIYPEYEKLTANTISLKSSFMLNFLTDEDKQNYYGPSLVYSKFPPHNIYGDDEEEGAEFWFDYITMRNLDSCYMTNDLSPILDEIDDDIKHWDERERQAMEQDDSIDWFEFFDNEELFDVEKSIEDSEIEINRIANESKLKIKSLITEINDRINELNGYDKDCTILRYFLRREVLPIYRLSDVHITNRFEIILTDYNIRLELTDKYKALYLLYLNHPEGINYENVRRDCREEFWQWYNWVSPKKIEKEVFYNTLEVTPKRDPVTELIYRTNKDLESFIGGALAKKYGIYQINKKHQICTTGYKVKFDVKNPFRKDQTPMKKEDSSYLKTKK